MGPVTYAAYWLVLAPLATGYAPATPTYIPMPSGEVCWAAKVEADKGLGEYPYKLGTACIPGQAQAVSK